jgi:aspartate/methionine/tyrosine aminotransferase
MNPSQALSAWIPKMPEPGPQAATSIDKTLLLWEKATGIALDPENTVIGRGVRDLLAATFVSVLKRDDDLWLPEDVYPVYGKLAVDAGLRARTFPTLPQPQLDFLTQPTKHATVVLPVPISPLGRLPSQAETDALLEWLHGSPHRLLIIDAVYTFEFEKSRSLMDLFLHENGDQCIALWSCSKSWLLPKSLGIAMTPRRFTPILANHVSPPMYSDLCRINFMLENHPDLWRQQQKAFTVEWQRLAPVISSADCNWQPPPTGYFSVMDSPFTTLLDGYGILSVPVSVFGSKRNDLSIVTCLHDLIQHKAVEIWANH